MDVAAFRVADALAGGSKSAGRALRKKNFKRKEEFTGTRGSKRKIRGTHNSCYEVVMLAVITTSGMCYECYEVL